MKKYLALIVIVAAIFGVTYYVKLAPKVAKAPVTTEETLSVVTADYVKYRGQDGKNAFELLQTMTQVGFKQYSFGVFVGSIGGVTPDKDHFWKLYVNGQESQVGADQVQTKNGDVIEWKLEEVKNNQ